MAEPILSYELKALINKIKEKYVVEFPIQIITPNYLLLAILEEKSCDGYNIVNRLMMDSTIDEFKQYIIDRILIDGANSIKQNDSPTFSDVFDTYAEEVMNSGASLVTSSLMFNTIIKHDNEIITTLTKLGVTPDQINETVIAYNTTTNSSNKEIKANKWNKKKTKDSQSTQLTTLTPEKLDEFLGKTGNSQPTRPIPNENNIVETNCENLVRVASTGAYDTIIGDDDVIKQIFDTFGKYERNTVAIVGPSGVGKTAVVQYLGRVLYEQNCPKMFRNKYLMKFADVISGVVIKEMSKLGKYIAFIDRAENMFMNKEAENNSYTFLAELFKTPNIYTIFTMTDSAYSKYVTSKPEFARLIHKIDIKVPDDNKIYDIVKSRSVVYENYNSVSFGDNSIREGIRLAKRFVTNEQCPASALNILDAAGSYVKMREVEGHTITALRNRLKEIETEKNSIQNSSSAKDFDRKDDLIREEIEINKQINLIEAKQNKNQVKTPVTTSDVKAAVSEMLNLPLSEMDDDEKGKLKRLSDNLRSVVIGQDDAINDIARAVKRQRVGLQNPNKPIVMLFVGTTGTGKSFLAKRLAYEMFGSEKSIVRLDMSEYSDKMSVSKLHGCFTPKMGVLMSNGEYKNIEDVVVGDKVITPDGNIRIVTHTWPKEYNGLIDVYRVSNSNIKIKCTPNHELLVCKGEYYKNGHINKKKTYQLDNVKYKQSSDVCLKDISVYPRNINIEKENVIYDLSKYILNNKQIIFDNKYIWNKVQYKYKLNRFITFDERLARIFGYYVSEGGCNKRYKTVTFTFNYNENEYISELINLLKDVFGDIRIQVKYNKKRNRCEVSVSNRCLTYFFSELCGRIVYEKHIPYDIFKCGEYVEMSFIETAFFGDGNKTTLNSTRYTTVSKKLGVGIHTILRNNGILSQFNERTYIDKRNNHNRISYYVYITGNAVNEFNSKMPSLKIKRENNGNKNIIRFGYMDDKFYYNKITKKEQEEYNGIVYDLTIDGDSSYIVNGMSVHNSAPGYVGYDDGGVLTEAIKKNGRCVLLLDEIEKANDEVFNVFLQVFDEGRLSDNKGTVVDFKNVIIIMTSNVGAKDISEKRTPIGFGSHDEGTMDREIIKKAIKSTFKPEFINRIDNICYFNKLTDDNLRQIIVNEVNNVKKKIEEIGFGMDYELCNGRVIDSIFNKVKEESEYGARPILREIQFQLEDKLTDYIIDNEVEPGHIFSYNDIYK